MFECEFVELKLIFYEIYSKFRIFLVNIIVIIVVVIGVSLSDRDLSQEHAHKPSLERLWNSHFQPLDVYV